jgi:hypothetical protein
MVFSGKQKLYVLSLLQKTFFTAPPFWGPGREEKQNKFWKGF